MKRKRLTNAELDSALVEIVDEMRPATVRQVFYQAAVRGLVEKDEAKGYGPVQRRLVNLRARRTMPYGWITDNARTVYGHDRYGGSDEFACEVVGLYRRDYWAEAAERAEVWIEKGALAGVLYGRAAATPSVGASVN